MSQVTQSDAFWNELLIRTTFEFWQLLATAISMIWGTILFVPVTFLDDC